MIQDARRVASETAIGSSNKTKMIDSFETVSLGRMTVIMVLQAEPEQQGKTKDAEVEVQGAEGEVPPELENVVEEEQQPEPLSVMMLVQPEQQSKSQDAEGKDLAMRETNEDLIEPIEVEPVPIISIQIPLEPQDPEPCSLTL
ncbi:hypothetical protein PIB30_069757 [Stylosanthes scabra]|uniref:Uncharacterized protein n=1 Tax=Stylosanthes scabra TaxID=79078 RepID=A0ABU6VRL5_9FABA|nr:hypothetical protein [Stylosanthes scabra]